MLIYIFVCSSRMVFNLVWAKIQIIILLKSQQTTLTPKKTDIFYVKIQDNLHYKSQLNKDVKLTFLVQLLCSTNFFANY